MKRLFKLTHDGARSEDSYEIIEVTSTKDSWCSFGAIHAPFIGASDGGWAVLIGHEGYEDKIPWDLGYSGLQCKTLDQAIELASILIKYYFNAELISKHQ